MRDPASLVRTSTGSRLEAFFSAMPKLFPPLCYEKSPKTSQRFGVGLCSKCAQINYFAAGRSPLNQNLKNRKNKPAKFWSFQNLAGKANNAY